MMIKTGIGGMKEIWKSTVKHKPKLEFQKNFGNISKLEFQKNFGNISKYLL